MPTHAEKRVLPYSPKQMYDLVADIERYPEFLPWCLAARITKRGEGMVESDLVIGFKMFRERFRSRAIFRPPHAIDVAYIKGPMRHLDNHWSFEPHSDGCELGFFIDFEFSSRLMQKAMGVLFNEAVHRMVSAFEHRAKKLYGSPSSPSK
jgi:coenzyme Q-binding protein COQ10